MGKKSGRADDLLDEQREANERLVLTALESQQRADEAESLERNLRETAELRERLMAALSHDLGNPLAAIMMVLQSISGLDALGDPERRLIAEAHASGRRMQRMISELLQFAQVRLGGGIMLRARPVVLAEICRGIIGELQDRSVPITLDCPPVLTGVWDPGLLAQVLSNVTGNAVTHATAGTTVKVTVHQRNENVVIEIRNQGSPISPELLPFIFEPFRGGSMRGGERVHLGLGLYIARELVLAHGGTLEASCADGATTFTVTLPREAA